MEHTYIAYNYPIVIVSVLVAIIASFITIELMGRVVSSREKREKRWILASSFIWGSGIWSMHFTGILAIESEVPFNYDVIITLISLFIPVIVVFFAFLLILFKDISKIRLLLASVLMGIGIISMHFIGMLGLNIHIEHHVINVLLSVFIAITASYMAMYIFSKVESKRLYIYALPIAALMGFAISGMHYSSMIPGTRYHFNELPLLHTSLQFMLSSETLLLSLVIISVLVIGTTYSLFRKENADLLKLKLAELHLATTVQEKSLPLPLEDDNIKITSFYKASEELSGDLYYWGKAGDNQYTIFIMDVMGHGVSASIISMSIKSFLQGVLENSTKPAYVMNELSKYMNSMFEGSENPFYFTGIYLLVNTDSNTIDYVNAGHPPGFWKEIGKPIQQLVSTCPPIGLLPKLPMDSKQITFQGSAKLILSTDGFLEGLSIDHQEHYAIIENLLQTHSDASIDQIKEKLLAASSSHHRFPDDRCLLVIEITGQS